MRERRLCGDGPSFKGVFARNLGELDRALSGRPYRAYLARQADSAYADWAGTFDSADAARQHSALEALVAPLQ